MTAFRNQPAEQERLDWQILREGAVSLYHNPGVLDEAISWFGQKKYHVCDFKCETWNSEADLHSAAIQVFHLSDRYGRNLDALNDVLASLQVPTAGGVLLVFWRFDAFAKRCPQTAKSLLDIIEQNSRRFLLTARRLIALVQSADPGIAFAPVGAAPVVWNRREWDISSRGLGYLQPLNNETDPHSASAVAETANGAEFTVCNQRGDAAFWAQRYTDALAAYTRAIALQPNAADTLIMRADTYDKLGREAEALADYARAVELSAPGTPTHRVALLSRAATYETLQRDAEALADYTRALEVQPTDPDTLYRRGLTFYRLQRYEEAIADFTAALALDSDNLTALTYRGRAYEARGRYEAALADFTAVLRQKPDAQEVADHLRVLSQKLEEPSAHR